MTLISCRGLTKSYGDINVLRDVRLDIAAGERVGLVGMNGAGKTTLANLIFGSVRPDEGTILRGREELKTGYLLQSTSYTAGTFRKMAVDDAQAGANGRFLELTSHLGLKKVREWSGERFAGLSGGEKTKLAIAHIWSSKPDLLILDEPTNHLDFEGVEWLIGELRTFAGAALIISHDRYFLDRTVNRIVELEGGASVEYPGSYTFYREEKARRFESRLREYEKRIRYEQKIEAEIDRLDSWSSKAHREAGKTGKMAEMRAGVKEFYRGKAKKMDRQIKSRTKRLEKLRTEGAEKPEEEAQVRFSWDSPDKRGRRIVHADRIGQAFGSRTLFRDSSFSVLLGEKIGLIGKNGCGKTTLLRMIAGTETPASGQLWVSPAARIAWLTQDVGDLDPRRSVLEQLQETHALRGEISKARTLLANMGFDESMLAKPIGQLSLGERTRVKLAELMLLGHDLLMLDEPTNHLDLASRERLEETLTEYDGTLLVVSHDRYLLEKICDKLLVFGDGAVQRSEHGFHAFMERAERERAAPREDDAQLLAERHMLIGNRIAALLGELSLCSPGDALYGALDAEFRQLTEEKKRLQERL
ncbi:ribosomal protection-like ABC-F family protein [Paenibacillus humicola]|uniref:ribosomal protection-like ABC-F family protein n=1 Tax=Paenibacillus humicola TaxID=3110540 RepID=UPI00237B2289|nr:ABC-F family ATP-binding cassette domain-containing protein [Paenibacillus humicola]